MELKDMELIVIYVLIKKYMYTAHQWQHEEVENALKAMITLEGSRHVTRIPDITNTEWIRYKSVTSDIQEIIRRFNTKFMKTTKINNVLISQNADISGTCLQETIDGVSFFTLLAMFGKPNKFDKGSKVDAEWRIITPYGVGTIYNYKNGQNYLGKEGQDVKTIIEWNIGGMNKETGLLIRTAIDCFDVGYNFKN